MPCSCDARCCQEAHRYVGVVLRKGTTIYSPWVLRVGDNVRVTVEVLSRILLTLTVRVFTRAEGVAGDGTEVDSTRTIQTSSVGRKLQEWGPQTGIGLNEWVRYQFNADTALPDVTGSHVAFRVLSPVWFDTIHQTASGLPSTGGTV